MKRLPLAVVPMVVAVAALAACAGAPTEPPVTTTPLISVPPGASPSQSPSVAPTTTTTGPTTSTWTSGPTVVNRTVPVPPVPQLLRIRSAAHPDQGFDRVTFDFVKTLPGYEIRYVDEVIADGSGEPVHVPGRRFLQITFRPAQAHDDSGTPVTPRSKTLNYPMLEAYAITGDFEGVLTVVLGLDDVVGYRVGEIPGEPGRIYIDVAA